MSNRSNLTIFNIGLQINVVLVSYLFVRQIKANPFDKIQNVSNVANILLILLVATILLLALIFTTKSRNFLHQMILSNYAVFVISIYSFSQLLPLRGTKYALGFDKHGSGDINKIIELASKLDQSQTYPPMYPRTLGILGQILGSSPQDVSKIHMVLFTLVSLLISFYLWKMTLNVQFALIITLTQMAFFVDVGSPYKSFSMWLAYQSLVGLYILSTNKIDKVFLKYLILNVSIAVSVITYPAFILWAFPSYLILYLYFHYLLIKNKVLKIRQLAFGLSFYLITLPYLISTNFFKKITELVLLNYSIGDNYFYEAVLRNPFYSPPLVILLSYIVIMILNSDNKKNLGLYSVLLVIIINLYVIRLLNASRMSSDNSVELWPRIDKPIFYLFILLVTFALFAIYQSSQNKDKSIFNKVDTDYVILVMIFSIFIVFAYNFGESLLNLFPQEGNMAWYSHK